MKKFIRDELQLSDVLKKIIKFEIVDDVKDVYCILAQMPRSLFAAEDIENDPEYDQQDEDLKYLEYSDDRLGKLPLDVVHKFQNIDLLVRIGKLNKNLLSDAQRNFLETTLSIKDRDHSIVTDADINYLLGLMKSCNRVDYDLLHDKTNEFTFNNNQEFRERAVLRVLHNLNFNDWVYRTRSINYNYLGNTLFIFEPEVSWVDANNVTRYLKIYIKLDVSKTNKCAVALVSFHD